jgi:hypothetical protein
MTTTQTTSLPPADRAALIAKHPKWMSRRATPTLGELALRLEAAEALIAALRKEVAALKQLTAPRTERNQENIQ